MTPEEKKIEEAAKLIAEYFVGHSYDYIDIENTIEHITNNEAIKEYWQKGMYSEEDLRKAFEAGELYTNDCKCGECHYCTEIKDGDEPDFDEWFEQNKKK